jgi:hypothetical protein
MRSFALMIGVASLLQTCSFLAWTSPGDPRGSPMSEAPQGPGSQPKLLDRVRSAIRVRHYSRRTEVAHVSWIRRDIGFHRMAHPATLGAPDVTTFLTWLATEQHVSASTQNQALAALLF